jgi:threonyl-tRNA synthetase
MGILELKNKVHQQIDNSDETILIKVFNLLEINEIRSLIDDRNETIGKKIRESELNKYPYLLILGEEEEKNGNVSLRIKGQDGKGNATMNIDDFITFIKEEVKKTEREFNV